jgi:lactoylglutathione lyase
MFVHTSIRSSNMERSIEFYTKLLGLKLISRREIKQNNAEIAFLQAQKSKGATLELTFYRNQKKFIQAKYEDRIFDHIGFEVANMKAIIEKLRKEKIIITDEPYMLGPSGPTIAFIEDPDGTLIELIERMEPKNTFKAGLIPSSK